MNDAMAHGPLEEVVPDVHWLQGTVRMGPGITINRVMVVLHHAGELTVVNAIRPQDPSILDALGTVKHVVRIGVHGMDDAWYREHYGAQQWGLEGRPETQRLLVPGGEMPVPWMQVVPFQQTVDPECVLMLDRGPGVLLTCDSVQHWPDKAQCSFLARGLTTVMGFQAQMAQIGPPWRKRMTPAGSSLKPDFERILEQPFDILIGGHGAPLRSGAKAALRETVAAIY